MKAVSEIRKQQNKEARGAKTRHEILQAAVHIASAEGLEGLTIGGLADELHMSKSGLFAHFGSKEELQLAVVAKARDIFVREVVEPAFKSERGLVRLLAMLDSWLDYVGRSVFRGGCFLWPAPSSSTAARGRSAISSPSCPTRGSTRSRPRRGKLRRLANSTIALMPLNLPSNFTRSGTPQTGTTTCFRTSAPLTGHALASSIACVTALPQTSFDCSARKAPCVKPSQHENPNERNQDE